MKSSFCRIHGQNNRTVLQIIVYNISVLGLLIFGTISVASPCFRYTGLIDIPTAYAMKNGVFNAGSQISVWDKKRNETAISVEIGLFDYAELKITGMIVHNILNTQDKGYVTGSLKIRLSQESGSVPGLSFGIDNFGEKIRDNSKIHDTSFYGVISKQFNLPFAHIFSGHLGIGNKSYVVDESIGKYLHGIFFGLSKNIALSSLDDQLNLACEIKGKSLNAGLRYTMNSGLMICLGVGQLNSDSANYRYYTNVSFTNELIMKRIQQASELAQKAVRIANESRPD